jgi:hypothetical protein
MYPLRRPVTTAQVEEGRGLRACSTLTVSARDARHAALGILDFGPLACGICPTVSIGDLNLMPRSGRLSHHPRLHRTVCATVGLGVRGCWIWGRLSWSASSGGIHV